MATISTLKHFVMAAVVGLLLQSSLEGQPTESISPDGVLRAELPKPQWRASWIWMPNGDEADMLLARKDFMLADQPEQAMLSITASSRFQLFINGSYFCNGPARCAPHHQSFDVLDVATRLRKGRNVIAVRVHHQRGAVSYYEPSRAGLLVQLDISEEKLNVAMQTDASWRVTADKSWLNSSPPMARFHLEACDRVDLRRRLDGWNEVGFDDTLWSKARVLKRESGWPSPQPNDRPTHLIPPWTSLTARDIPYLRETVAEPQRMLPIISVPDVPSPKHFGSDTWDDAPSIGRFTVRPPEKNGTPSGVLESPLAGAMSSTLTIPANASGGSRTLIYDFGEVHNGRPVLDIMAPAGTVVDIVSSPYLFNDVFPDPVVASRYVDRVVLSGKREQWESFYGKPVRWMTVIFRHLDGEAKLFGVNARVSEYPFDQKGAFRTPEFPQLEELWNASAKTIRVCTTDAYTDNYRERRQYAQTSYYACLGNYPVFADSALQRRYLKQIADEQLPNGMMPAYAPRHGEDFMVILDSNCFWLRGLHQYLLYTGDEATVQGLLPAARKLLSHLQSFANADGLIDSPAYAYWLDHAMNDRRGANFCLNGHYLAALEDFAQVLRWLDIPNAESPNAESPNAESYEEQAKRMRVALREQAWDPEKQLFADAIVDGERSDQFSEHANAMAMALRIGTPKQIEAIASQLSKDEDHDFIHRESGIVMVTPAMSYFLHAGLCEAGFLDQSMELAWSRFAHMLTPVANGTLWEEWWLDGTGRTGRFRKINYGRSDAQTESAFFPALFARYILGIEPMQPGLRDVVLRYHASSRLLHRHGVIPTPSGLLEVNWDTSSAEFRLTLGVPAGTTARVDLASLERPPHNRISLNTRPASHDQIKNGFLILPPGKHNVIVKRQ
ncbi:Bacterial alpha-L-rhamnosidase [Planctomycetes bacterium CA13]|uniref:Bacterial alpha-L-rhamnosidase n=1 Tax=Novipirellula herctigrandis TaxID=2527986 RepID=A0A5C5YV12_9BACT|nr:Bacterial alpha-L-rhamnosidase [Planctomycetes bacterium CA13]